jgi:hypothetical protein
LNDDNKSEGHLNGKKAPNKAGEVKAQRTLEHGKATTIKMKFRFVVSEEFQQLKKKKR